MFLEVPHEHEREPTMMCSCAGFSWFFVPWLVFHKWIENIIQLTNVNWSDISGWKGQVDLD